MRSLAADHERFAAIVVAIIHAWRVADAGVPDYSAAMRGASSRVAK
jgi:hypothetical protein